MDYNSLIFIHIISVILLLGVGGGSAFYKFMADRSQNLEVIAHTNRVVVLADWLFTTPSVIVQPISGFMLLNLMGIPLETHWVWLSIILYAISISLWLVAVWLQIKMRALSREALKRGEKLEGNYYKLVNYWIALGVFSALLMGIIFLFMVFKY